MVREIPSSLTLWLMKKNRLKVQRIQNYEGEWMEDQNQIAETTIQFFQKQFSKGEDNTDFDMLMNCQQY